MKRVLADHNVPRPLVRVLTGFHMETAADRGWSELRNGKLLAIAEESGFDVLLTGDQSLRYEQNMADRKISVVAMSDNHWKIVKTYVPAISDVLDQVQPGKVCTVFCGKFVPKKFRADPPD